ncbi:MAG TPA: response regulator [Cyclobacteriaceae bacterium]|jgi:two-component system response regulator|nr:response regulator [Cyclobacteriaceae bacterium]
MEKEKQIDVLLIEDNLDDSELTIYSLLSANDRLRYQHFTNGEEAIEFVFTKRTSWGEPMKDYLKLIIIDLKLPNANGFEIARTFKESEHTKTIPIVVLTSSKREHDIHIAYEIGINSYVIKPDKFEGYLNKIGSLTSYWCSVNERHNQNAAL